MKAYRLALAIGLCGWTVGAWAQQEGIVLQGILTQHANDAGRGYFDIPFQTTPAAGYAVEAHHCSLQLNPFPNAGTSQYCAQAPVVLPVPVWENCEELLPRAEDNQYTWRIHSPMESRYTFQIRATTRSGNDVRYVYSNTETFFPDMKANLPRIKGPKHRRVSRCSNVRIPVRTESQPRVFYSRNGEFPPSEGEHAIGNPCYPYKVEFQVPLRLGDFHENRDRQPVEQPGWELAPGQTLYEKLHIADIWGHSTSPSVEFSLSCEPDTPPSSRFLTNPPPESPLPTAVFEFESDIVDATFQCSLNDADFAACTSPHRVDFNSPENQFRIRAVNALGLIGEPQTQSWRQTPSTGGAPSWTDDNLKIDNPRSGIQHSSLAAVDGQAPTGTQLFILLSAPANLGGGIVAKCHLSAEGGRWRCPIVKTLYDADGYRLEVHAWNGSAYARLENNFSIREEEATRMGTLTGERRPHIISEGEEGENVAFEVAWAYVDLEIAPESLECRLDGGAYGPCGRFEGTTLHYETTNPPSPGLHRFQVRVADSAISTQMPNATPLEYTWARLGDTEAFKPHIATPRLARDGATYIGGRVLTLSGKAEPFLPLSIYLNGATEPTCARVEVTPDGNWECDIPEATEGTHEVTAWVDVLPKDAARRHWTSLSFTFLQGSPKTLLTRRPYKHEQNNVATFEFASPRKQVSFECSLDGDEFKRCESPYRAAPLAQGEHLFQVRATDFAEQTELEPVTWRWTVGEPAASSGCSGCTATASASGWILGLLSLGLLARHRRK